MKKEQSVHQRIKLCLLVEDVTAAKNILLEVQNLDVRDENGETLLMSLCGWSVVLVKELIHKGADVGLSAPDGTTALMKAVVAKDKRTMNLLIQSGANVNQTDISGETALAKASVFDYSAMADTLLSQGAEVNKSDNAGITPLMFASMLNNLRVVRVLLTYNADIDIKCSDGKTALSYAQTKRMREALTVGVKSRNRQ